VVNVDAYTVIEEYSSSMLPFHLLVCALSSFCGVYAARIVLHFTLPILGYTSRGIRANSIAARIMRLEMASNQGRLRMNGLSATLQSAADHGQRGMLKWIVSYCGLQCGLILGQIVVYR